MPPSKYRCLGLHPESLAAALVREGHEVDSIAVPFNWYPCEQILDHIPGCRMLDVSESDGRRIDLMIAVTFPAYCIPRPNEVIWLLHQHRSAYEIWEHPAGGDMRHYASAPDVRHTDSGTPRIRPRRYPAYAVAACEKVVICRADPGREPRLLDRWLGANSSEYAL